MKSHLPLFQSQEVVEEEIAADVKKIFGGSGR